MMRPSTIVWNSPVRVVELDVDDVVGILESLDAIAAVIARLGLDTDTASFVQGFNQELRAKHDLPDGPDFTGLNL